MTCGIYIIQNKNTKQKYIGQSVNIEKRWIQHINAHDIQSSRIEKAINKYGSDNFSFSILEELINDSELLNEREKYWIQYYNTYNDKNHYNLTPGGEFCPMKDINIAKKLSKKMSGKNASFYGKRHSQETINKMSQIKQGAKNPFFNKHHTDENKLKLSKMKNTSGYYRVNKIKDKRYKKGFYYVYHWYENHKDNKLYSANIDKLKKKVLERKLPWFKLE